MSGTNNGKAPQLAGYYAYWERSIFTALNTMVLTAMRTLVTMLHARSAKKAAAAGLQARPPLFKVNNFCSAIQNGKCLYGEATPSVCSTLVVKPVADL